MMKTSNFFVIDNYNTVPTDLIQYCEDYLIYDASTKKELEKELSNAGLKYIKIPRTGHNISTYFRYFDENYDSLPEVICLTKGHMIGRHCSREFFERVYNNKYFTYLYEDKEHRNNMDEISFLTMENQYLEQNNSWYVNSPMHPHKYFINLNDLLQFIYEDPVLPQYVTFAPGACYIVLRDQVIKHSKIFYRNMNKIMTYGLNPNFPVEAHMVERILPIIFEANYKENAWMNDEKMFDMNLKETMAKVGVYDGHWKRRIKEKLRNILRK